MDRKTLLGFGAFAVVGYFVIPRLASMISGSKGRFRRIDDHLHGWRTGHIQSH